MTSRHPLTAAAAILVFTACACSDSRRQEAAVALDEARLQIASARQAGAESAHGPRFSEAQAVLGDAESLYAGSDYGGARKLAQKARETAAMAESEARMTGSTRKIKRGMR